jgi:antitoxin Phd
MRTVSETDAKRRFAALLDEAQREPVVIQRERRDIAVLLSAADYDRLRAAEAEGPRRAPSRTAAESLHDAELTDIVADDDGG